MKVLLTGADGQVGRALAQSAPAGCDVVRLARRDLDITDARAVGEAIARHAPDCLVNTAAWTAVDRAEAEPDAAMRVNATAAECLADACSRSGAKLIHYSTDFVFDGRQGSPYLPSDPTAPLNAYGRSKRAGELAVLARPGNLVIRTAWVYSGTDTNFARTMLRLMAEREEIRVVADQIGTPTHAASLARATWDLIAGDAEGVLHFTDAGVASWYDFAVAIGEEALALGLLSREARIVPIATADYPTPAARPACAVLDKSATWERLGYAASHWRSELRIMLRELKEAEHG